MKVDSIETLCDYSMDVLMEIKETFEKGELDVKGQNVRMKSIEVVLKTQMLKIHAEQVANKTKDLELQTKRLTEK